MQKLPIKAWLVVPANVEYNDEYYYTVGDEADRGQVYTNLQEAQDVCKLRNAEAQSYYNDDDWYEGEAPDLWSVYPIEIY